MTMLNADTILYGGDYNPEQWPQEVWERDLELFARAGITTGTLNVFSWATLQPSEDVYDFAQLDRIVETVSAAGLAIVLATSTAAMPAWMSLRHPDVNRVDARGITQRHGRRHNPCISSPSYRRWSAALAGRLAERYAATPHLVAWHVSNEYGGFCWCDRCAEGFRGWLRERYGSIGNVNAAWNSAFWSHTYHSFDEIFPPNELGGVTLWSGKAVLPSACLDYRRFYGEQVLDSYREEKAAIRRHDPDRPVTTNFMGTFPDYDYFAWSDDLDIASWDSYPGLDSTAAQTALRHDLMRAVGRQRPWMLMEQTPSRQNWAAYCALKRPGQMRQLSWQAIAHGADTVQFFQLRQSRGGCEKFHGAVISASGSDKTREYREVAELGAELGRVSHEIVGSVVEQGKVAVVFDWPSWWGIDFSAGPSRSLDYVAEVERWYAELHRRAVPVDIVPATGPFDGYDVVVAPCLYMLSPRATVALREYVEGGRRLVLTPMSALVDENDMLFQGEAPVPLRDLAGVWVEETDALPPGVSVPLRFARGSAQSAAGSAQGAGSSAQEAMEEAAASAPAGEVLADVVHPDAGTRVLATYDGEYYAGSPALTFRPSTGTGGVFYMATFPDAVAVRKAVDAILEGTTVTPADLPEGVELTRRVHPDGTTLTFLTNSTGTAQALAVDVRGTDLLTGTEVDGALKLAPYGVAVVRSR